MEPRGWGATTVGKAPRSGKLAAATSSLSTSVVTSSRNSENSPLVASLLQELHTLLKQSHKERQDGEQTLVNISKTHDRMKQEQRVSLYFKQKIHGLYATALTEAKKELVTVTQMLSKISDTRRERAGEKHSTVAAPVVAVTTASSTSSTSTARPPAPLGPLGLPDLDRRPSMRRGMLMTVLHQYAVEQPVWRGKSNESPPPLCGAISADDKYKCKPADQVAARVRTEDGEEQWILAEVVSYNSHNHRYIVDDIDEEGHNEKRRYHVSKRRIIPLPIYKADPATTLQALFKVNQLVLALYPQTTCFYRAIIHEQPKDVSCEYAVLFEDTSYPEGYSPPLEVPQRYVLPMRETRKR